MKNQIGIEITVGKDDVNKKQPNIKIIFQLAKCNLSNYYIIIFPSS